MIINIIIFLKYPVYIDYLGQITSFQKSKKK